MYCDLWKQYIQVRKLFKGGNYSRVETIRGNTVFQAKNVGVGGYLLGVGVNPIGTTHRHGYGADHVLSYKIVLADGSIALVDNDFTKIILVLSICFHEKQKMTFTYFLSFQSNCFDEKNIRQARLFCLLH